MSSGATRPKRATRRKPPTGVFRQAGCETWSVRYSVQGKKYVESSGSTDMQDAVNLRKRRLAEKWSGRFVGPAAERTSFEDLAAMLLDDYRANGRKSLDRAERSLRHLRKFFGPARADAITTDRLKAYVAGRLEAGAARATVRNELAALRRSFNLAYAAERVLKRPAFPCISVNNARQGFFEEM